MASPARIGHAEQAYSSKSGAAHIIGTEYGAYYHSLLWIGRDKALPISRRGLASIADVQPADEAVDFVPNSKTFRCVSTSTCSASRWECLSVVASGEAGYVIGYVYSVDGSPSAA
jgi:hypothetical protein